MTKRKAKPEAKGTSRTIKPGRSAARLKFPAKAGQAGETIKHVARMTFAKGAVLADFTGLINSSLRHMFFRPNRARMVESFGRKTHPTPPAHTGNPASVMGRESADRIREGGVSPG